MAGNQVADVGGCPPVSAENAADFLVRVPWFYSIRVASPASPLPLFVAGRTLYMYTSPIEDWCEIWGLNCNLDTISNNIKVAVNDMTEPRAFFSFVSIPVGALFGVSTQLAPILYLSRPYLLRPGARLQIMFRNNSTATDFENLIITVVGVRLKQFKVDPCRSSGGQYATAQALEADSRPYGL